MQSQQTERLSCNINITDCRYTVLLRPWESRGVFLISSLSQILVTTCKFSKTLHSIMSTLAKQHSLLQEHCLVFHFRVQQKGHSWCGPHSQLASFSSFEATSATTTLTPRFLYRTFQRTTPHSSDVNDAIVVPGASKDVGWLNHCMIRQLTRHPIQQSWSRAQFPSNLLTGEVRSSRSEEMCPITVTQINLKVKKQSLLARLGFKKFFRNDTKHKYIGANPRHVNFHVHIQTCEL